VSAVNLALRFACEVAALAAVAWCGWRINPALGVALPLVVALVWGLWIAPRARRRLSDPARFVVELVVFTAATAALVSVGQPLLAAVFAAVALTTAVLVRRWPEPVP
jgi:FtsH-binding integral membrane protein